MKILNVSTDEFHVEVQAEANGMIENFYVQLNECEHAGGLSEEFASDRFPDGTGGFHFENDEDDDDAGIYKNFNRAEIIEAAEEHAREEFNEQFSEEEIDFGGGGRILVGNCVVIMRTDNEDDMVELVIKDKQPSSPYGKTYKETGVKFNNKEDALNYASTFETGEYEDFAGLVRFMHTIEGNHHFLEENIDPDRDEDTNY